jgi:hypothetical protein
MKMKAKINKMKQVIGGLRKSEQWHKESSRINQSFAKGPQIKGLLMDKSVIS